MPQWVTGGQGEVWSLTVVTPAAITLVDMTSQERGEWAGRGTEGMFLFHLSTSSTFVLGNDAMLLVLNLKSQPKAEWPNIYQKFAKHS